MTINKLQSDIDLNFQFQENKPMSGEYVDLQPQFRSKYYLFFGGCC